MELESYKPPTTTVEDVQLYKQIYRIQQVFDIEKRLFTVLENIDEAMMGNYDINDYEVCTMYRKALNKLLMVLEHPMKRQAKTIEYDYWNDTPLGMLDLPDGVLGTNIPRHYLTQELKGLKCLLELPMTLTYSQEVEFTVIGRGSETDRVVQQTQIPYESLVLAHRAIQEFYGKVGLDLSMTNTQLIQMPVDWKKERRMERLA
tara:strand:- start:500 stop:1108 length:609 start_codon:yes stop_codon:yes gene_type:complete